MKISARILIKYVDMVNETRIGEFQVAVPFGMGVQATPIKNFFEI